MSRSAPTRLQPELGALLSELRSRITRYVLFEGLAVVLVVLGGLFWLTLGIDSAWFGFRKLELPPWFRVMLAIASLATLAVVVYRLIICRIYRRFGEKDLALVLERQYPELNDGLVTAVEMRAGDSAADPPMTRAMIARTVDNVVAATREMPLEPVFAARPLRLAIVGAAVMVVSVGGLGIARGDSLQRWWNAFVLQEETYWHRETQLRVRAIVQPGDRIREFRTTDEAFELLHPRNADVTLLIDVSPPEGDQQWKRPDRIRLDLARRSAGSRRVYLSPIGNEFRFAIEQLNDDVEFHLQGGDFANRLPFRIRVVDPPRIDQIVLNCDYPAYTGWNETHAREVVVSGAQTTLPQETAFELVARVNKTLRGFNLQAGETSLTVDNGEAVLSVDQGEGNPRRTLKLSGQVTDTLLDAARTTIRLPVLISPDAAPAEEADSFTRLRIHPDEGLRFYLHDADDIISAEPITLSIAARPDAPPVVECRRQGVRQAITRRATVPVAGVIRDDFGIANARFEFRVDDEQDWRPRPFRRAPTGRPLEFTLQRDEDEMFERFDVSPLRLEEGQRLTLTVYAEDGDDIHGPHIARSERFQFRIVSNEELLALLYGREINLRQRFEEVIRQVDEVRSDLITQRDAMRGRADRPESEQQTLDEDVLSCGVRTGNTVRKNLTECRDIEADFREIVEELVNNAIPPRTLAAEMRSAIVVPLNAINTIGFPRVKDELDAFKLAAERQEASTNQIDEAIAATELLLRQMRNLLDHIKEVAELHKIVKDLKLLIDAQNDLLDKTKGLQKKKLIEKLRGSGSGD